MTCCLQPLHVQASALCLLDKCVMICTGWLFLRYITAVQAAVKVYIHRCIRHRNPTYFGDYCMCACVWSSPSPAATICQDVVVPRYCRSMFGSNLCFFCCRTNILEFIAWWFAGSRCWQWTFWAGLKRTYSLDTECWCITLSRSTNRYLLYLVLVYL